MITIKANLHLYRGKRETPFTNGYRPTFDFGMESLTSGRIRLLGDKENVFPGEIATVEIDFLFKEFLGKKFKVGEIVFFTEGLIVVGEIEILDIISE